LGAVRSFANVMTIDFFAKQVYNLIGLYDDGNAKYSMCFL